MTAFPDTTWIVDDGRTVTEMKAAMQDIISAATQCVGGAAVETLTLSAGSVAPSVDAVKVDTEGGAATDDLDRLAVTNVRDGHVVFAMGSAPASRVVTCRNQAGGSGELQLRGQADFELVTGAVICLKRMGTAWVELFRTIEAAASTGYNAQVFTASGTFTVPEGVTGVRVTAVGGGGGGGGGAGASAGSNGSAGATTSFGTHVSVAGGAGGDGGGNLSLDYGGAGGSPFGRNGEHGVRNQRSGRGGERAGSLFGYGYGGKGGDGGYRLFTKQGGGGGGSTTAAPVVKQLVSGLTPGEAIAVTVGAGGAGGAGAAFAGGTSGGAGEAGGAGVVIVEW